MIWLFPANPVPPKASSQGLTRRTFAIATPRCAISEIFIRVISSLPVRQRVFSCACSSISCGYGIMLRPSGSITHRQLSGRTASDRTLVGARIHRHPSTRGYLLLRDPGYITVGKGVGTSRTRKLLPLPRTACQLQTGGSRGTNLYRN